MKYTWYLGVLFPKHIIIFYLSWWCCRKCTTLARTYWRRSEPPIKTVIWNIKSRQLTSVPWLRNSYSNVGDRKNVRNFVFQRDFTMNYVNSLLKCCRKIIEWPQAFTIRGNKFRILDCRVKKIDYWSTSGVHASPYYMDDSKVIYLRHSRKLSWFDSYKRFLYKRHPYPWNRINFSRGAVKKDVLAFRGAGLFWLFSCIWRRCSWVQCWN